MGKQRSCILVFMKSPEKGCVKTRLAASIGEMAALQLYKCFVEDTLSMISQSGYEFNICYYPKHAERGMAEWLGYNHIFWPQEGKDLGERMANAFIRAFAKGCDKALLMGTDIPDLPVSVIDKAFDRLKNKDAVIGPALDGGYYLIGFNSDSFISKPFENIKWSTKTVFENTVKILETEKAGVHILPQWRDIDRYDDLMALMNSAFQNGFDTSRTYKYLSDRKSIFL